MNLKDLLGDAYQEGMSLDDVNTALSNKNLVDLSTGNYVDVNKYNREINDLQTKLANKDKEFNNAKTASNDSQALIADLQQQLKNLAIESNRSNAVAGVSEAKSLLGIKDDDSEYSLFVTNVSDLDKKVSSEIVSYFNKQIKNAYEKGKQDGTKNSLGDMGKQRTSASSKGAEDPGAFGKKLAQSIASNASTVDYFSRK